MRIGVHCSIRSGFASALEEAERLGCEAVQIFTQSPRGWKTRITTDIEYAAFRELRLAKGLDPVVVHSPYLPNLCTSNPELFNRSLDTLKEDMRRAEKLGADFLVIHPGAYSPQSNYRHGLEQIHFALNDALAAVPGHFKLLIENMAGGGRRMGSQFQELADMLKGLHQPERAGICFDTCHATGAGYDLSEKKGVGQVLDVFNREVGLEKIFVFHVNDSKGAVGCHRDLHEHLGKGHVGLKGFKALFEETKFNNCALILETPKDSPRADVRNLKTLRACIPSENGQ